MSQEEKQTNTPIEQLHQEKEEKEEEDVKRKTKLEENRERVDRVKVVHD